MKAKRTEQSKREPYTKPELHTHEPLRNITAIGSGFDNPTPA